MKRLWTEETVTFQGKHLAFDGAYCDPKPIQQLPEIWVGGGGEKVTLRIEARHADKTNWQTGLERVRAQVGGAARSTATTIGRDFDSIVRTHGPDCRLFDSEADLQRVARLARRRVAVGPGRPTTSTCATTSSAPSSRSPRRCRSSSTRAAASSCCGSATTRRRESLERVRGEVVPQVSG